MCGEQLGEVMSLVIRVVNFIVARALHDRQFKALLDEVGNAYRPLSAGCQEGRCSAVSRLA
ncbi:General transcription factor II-I repeat domain-containing protein 2-like [Caligus rogercresseyi]|uniref:General transcription factor II-I repeat domain-containing protein 2-like n=1 Tax=Caligus rogercresseyi TaxID=217165 RepID=A0A7T8KKD4_CALRO|nr:General transcription factor II-I repeat domain-containing protein 2-like [Caligus rogercresseyi]